MTTSAAASTLTRATGATRPAHSGIANDMIQFGLALVMVPFTLPWLIVGRGLPLQDDDRE